MVNESFTAIDFETATPQKMACQVGIIVVKDGEIVERVKHLIQPPGNRYYDQCIAVHHITPKDTIKAPTFDKVWPLIEKYLTSTVVVAHKADFDYSTLMENLAYYGILPMGIPHFECTYKIFGYKLESLCYGFGIEYSNHHDALFDAECCARFYLNYLRGIAPDESKMGKPSRVKKSPAKRHASLSGDILKKDLSQADPNNPFYDRNVVITGVFPMDRTLLALQLKSMGADINTSITKKTHFVIIGEAPGPSKIEKLDKLVHDGFNVRSLYWEDLKKIFKGRFKGYVTEKEVKKDLSLTYDHYVKHSVNFENMCNVIASKELYYGKGLRGKSDLFNQITGNLGAFGNNELYPDTNICVLSDKTIENLQNGVKDETIKYIENYYNKNKAIVFDLDFITESAILDFCKARCEACGDELTLELYNKYMDSIG